MTYFLFFFFFFNDTATTEIYTLSLHDALPIWFELVKGQAVNVDPIAAMANAAAVSQTLHMTLAAYAATGFAVAGIMCRDRKSTRLNSSHLVISYAVFCLKKKTK